MKSPEASRGQYFQMGITRPGLLAYRQAPLIWKRRTWLYTAGSIDKEKFATGEYLIYQPNDGWGKGKDYEYHALKAGDTLTVSFYDYEAEDYVDKTLQSWRW